MENARRGVSSLNRQPSRLDVRLVECPECHAGPGEQCRGRRGLRLANHQARVNSFLWLIGDSRLLVAAVNAGDDDA